MLSVLIVGAGMYVCGKGTPGMGVLLPAVLEGIRRGLVKDIVVAGTSCASGEALRDKMPMISHRLGLSAHVDYYPTDTDSPKAYQEALGHRKYDCALVSVPDDLHFEIASELIRRGIHVLVVKPLTPTVAEGLILVREARLHGCYGLVDYHKRYDEANRLMKSIFASGRIGKPVFVAAEFTQRIEMPLARFRSWASRTNVFQYLGSHYVDLIYYATGARPVRALAVGQRTALVALGIDTFDAIEALVEWSCIDGHRFVSSIVTGWVDPGSSSAMSDQRIKLIGTAGRYESDQKNRGVQVVSDLGVEDINPYFAQVMEDIHGIPRFEGYGEQSVAQFLEDVHQIKNGLITPEQLRANRPTLESSLVATAVSEAVTASLGRQNEWIDIQNPEIQGDLHDQEPNP